MNSIGFYAKAVVATVTAFGGAYAVAAAENGVSVAEWVGIVVATIVAGATVFAVPNLKPQEESEPVVPGNVDIVTAIKNAEPKPPHEGGELR